MRDSRLNVMLSSMSHGVNLEIHATESIRETWKFKRVSSIYREFRLAVMSHGVHDSGDLEIRVSCDTESVSSRGAADRGRERSLLSAPAQRFNRGIFDINNVLRM